MDKKSEIIEVAILTSHSHYDHYEDSHRVLARLLNEDWVKMTREELEVLRQNQHAIARELEVESLFIVEKPTHAQLELCFASIKTIMDRKEAERKAREERHAKARKAAQEKAEAQRVAKAKKALEKAKKVLEEAGEL